MNQEVKYMRLTDQEHKGEIIKQIGRKFFDLVNGEWTRCGISIGYFYPDAPEFECYEYISEQEALKSLNIN